jgi:signal transduction histidine kinase
MADLGSALKSAYPRAGADVGVIVDTSGRSRRDVEVRDSGMGFAAASVRRRRGLLDMHDRMAASTARCGSTRHPAQAWWWPLPSRWRPARPQAVTATAG